MPDADPAAYSSRALLPIPGSPRSTSTPLCPARAPLRRPSSFLRASCRPCSTEPMWRPDGTMTLRDLTWLRLAAARPCSPCAARCYDLDFSLHSPVGAGFDADERALGCSPCARRGEVG